MLSLFLIGSIISFLVGFEGLLLSLEGFHQIIIIIGCWASESLIHIIHDIECVTKLGKSLGFLLCLREVNQVEDSIQKIAINMQRLSRGFSLIFQFLKPFFFGTAGNNLHFEKSLDS